MKNFKQFIVSEAKQKIIPVTVKCEFKTGFCDYGTPALNKKAKRQIADFVKELLQDEAGSIDLQIETDPETGEEFDDATQTSKSFKVTVE